MKFLSSIAALLAMAVVTFADVRDGSSYRSGGVSVTVSITARPNFNDVQVTYRSSGQTSGPHAGTPGNGSSSANPTASDAASSNPLGGERFRINGGRMQRLNASGQWRSMGRPRKTQGAGAEWVRAGDPVPRDGVLQPDELPLDGIEQRVDPLGAPIPVKAFDLAPFDGWFGDDVTTLPDDPSRDIDL